LFFLYSPTETPVGDKTAWRRGRHTQKYINTLKVKIINVYNFNSYPQCYPHLFSWMDNFLQTLYSFTYIQTMLGDPYLHCARQSLPPVTPSVGEFSIRSPTIDPNQNPSTRVVYVGGRTEEWTQDMKLVITIIMTLSLVACGSQLTTGGSYVQQASACVTSAHMVPTSRFT
jgi:hypothetical protein